MDYEWDAMFCTTDYEWREGRCADPNCGYCANRPVRPSQAPPANPAFDIT
jgi:hypothetical protein